MILLKIKGEVVQLNDWDSGSAASGLFLDIEGVQRHSHSFNGQSNDYISLFFSKKEGRWLALFMGPKIGYLRDVYRQMYPKHPHYLNGQLDEAKKHIDEFLYRFNNLKAFL